MSKAQAAPIGNDDARSFRGLEQSANIVDAEHVLDRSGVGIGRPGDYKQRIARRPRQPDDAPAEELMQRARDRQRGAGGHRFAGFQQRPSDLQRQQRVALRCLLELYQRRPRKVLAESRREQLMERAQAELLELERRRFGSRKGGRQSVSERSWLAGARRESD